MKKNRSATSPSAWPAIWSLLMFAFVAQAQTPRFAIPSYTDRGGGVSVGGPFTVYSTVGQSDAGQISSGQFAINGGFWGTPPSVGVANFSAGFDDGLPPAGTAVFGNAAIEGDGGVGNSGCLKLTKALGDQQGSWIISDFSGGMVVNGFNATFQARLGGGTATPADGYSFCWATDLPNGPIGEEGSGSGLIVAFDSFDNGGGEAPAIDVKWGGVTVGHEMVPASLFTSDPEFFQVNIHLNDAGALDVTYNGTAIYTDFVIPGFQAQAGARFGFGARTGGLNENLFLDNVTINASVVPKLFLSRPVSPDVVYDFNNGLVPPGTAVYGNAVVAGSGGVGNSGVLKLTINANEQTGSFVVNDFYQGGIVAGFQAAFKVRVGGGTAPPADGFSFCWANDLPNGPWSDEGAGSGLTVAFDNYDNGRGEAPAVDVKWNGATLYRVRVPTLSSGSDFVNVFINLSVDGKLDVVYGDRTVYNHFPVSGATPLAGARFGLAARTGGLNDNHWVDDLCILAGGVPARPELSIRLGLANSVILSWPNPSTGFLLEAAPTTLGNGWTTVSQNSIVVAGEKQVTLTPTGPGTMFRLRKP